MDKLESVDIIYKYLIYAYQQTGIDFVKKNVIGSETLKGLNPSSLFKFHFLVELNNKFKWNGNVPRYSTAYDYYNQIRGNKRRYTDLLEILDKPEKYEANDISEALAVTYQENMLTGKKEEETKPEQPQLLTKKTTTNEILEILEVKRKEQGSIVKEGKKSVITNDDLYKLSLNIDQKFIEIDQKLGRTEQKVDGYEKEAKVVRELMTELVNATMRNIDATTNAQNSISKIIAILKTNQDNLFDITATLFHILQDMYLHLGTCAIKEEDVENLTEEELKTYKLYQQRKKNICTTLEYVKRRVENNILIVNKYGNGNSLKI
jgi:hypothetical protein